MSDNSKKYLTMKNILTLGALVALGFCLWFGKSKTGKDSWVMIPTLIAFLALLIFANLDKFSEFRFKIFKTVLEGKIREAEEATQEAKSTIKQLRSLAKIMAHTTLGLVKRTGRLGGYSYDEKEEVKESTLKVLREIGISEEEIEEVVSKSQWHKFVEFDYAHLILGGSRAWPPDLPQVLRGEWSKFRRKFGFNNIAKPADLTEILDKYGLLSDEAKELITDYEYYIKHRKQRRPEVWAKREKWSHLRRNNNQQ